MPIQDLHISLAYTESFPALPDQIRAGAPMAFLGKPDEYAAHFQAAEQLQNAIEGDWLAQKQVIDAQFDSEPETKRIHLRQLARTFVPRLNPPDTLMTPFAWLDRKTKHKFWAYYLENRIPQALDPAKAWHFVVPFRMPIAVQIQNPFAGENLRCRVVTDCYIYPHGLAVVLALYCRFSNKEGDSSIRGFSLEGVMRRALELYNDARFPVTRRGQSEGDLTLDEIGALLLSDLRGRVLGADAEQGVQPTTPLSVATIVQATGWDGQTPVDQDPALHRALEGLCSWKRNWQDVQIPQSAADVNLLMDSPAAGDCVYHHPASRAVWMPTHFQPGGKPHTLTCYHRNLMWVTLQTEMLAQAILLWNNLPKENKPLSPALETLAFGAAVRIGLLYASKKSRDTITYNSASPRAYLTENDYVDRVHAVRKYFKETRKMTSFDDLAWAPRAQ